MSSSHDSSSPIVSLEEIVHALDKFDVESKGHVPYKQLKAVMRDLGLDPREAEVAKFVDTLKTTQKGDYRHTHFSAQALFEALKNRSGRNRNVDEIQTAFKFFDVEGKGFIDVNDLHNIANELSEGLNADELKEMIEIVGVKTSGQVSFEEFATVMKKTALY